MKNNLAERIREEFSYNSSNFEAQALAKQLAEACEEAHAKDPVLLNLNGASDVSDYYLIVSGKSDRQVQGICNRVISIMAQYGIEPISIEGFDSAHWVLLDFGEVVLHIFYEPMREHFDLEGLWMKATREVI